VALAVRPERQRVDQRLADDELGRVVGGAVEEPAPRPRQVEVERRARAQVRADLAPVERDDLAVLAEQRDDERAGQVLVAGFA
jgi:hypothetical protein